MMMGEDTSLYIPPPSPLSELYEKVQVSILTIGFMILQSIASLKHLRSPPHQKKSNTSHLGMMTVQTQLDGKTIPSGMGTQDGILRVEHLHQMMVIFTVQKILAMQQDHFGSRVLEAC